MILIKYRLVDRPLFQGNGSLMRIHTRKDLFSHQKEHRCYCLFSLHIQSIVCMEFVCVQMKVSQVLLQFHRYTFSNSVCGVLKVWTNWAHYCAQELNRYHQMPVTLAMSYIFLIWYVCFITIICFVVHLCANSIGSVISQQFLLDSQHHEGAYDRFIWLTVGGMQLKISKTLVPVLWIQGACSAHKDCWFDSIECIDKKFNLTLLCSSYWSANNWIVWP